MQVVKKYYPDAELIDADRALDPYSKRSHPLCNASGCFFNPALFPRMSRKHLKTLCDFSDDLAEDTATPEAA